MGDWGRWIAAGIAGGRGSTRSLSASFEEINRVLKAGAGWGAVRALFQYRRKL